MKTGQSACPVCDGKGFVTTVAGPRIRRPRAAAAVAAASLSPSFAPSSDPDFLAAMLLRHFDRSWVAKLFTTFADSDYALSRAQW